MAIGRMTEPLPRNELPHKLKRNSLLHLSGCSSIALWFVVAAVGTYILYGLLVGITATSPIQALK